MARGVAGQLTQLAMGYAACDGGAMMCTVKGYVHSAKLFQRHAGAGFL